MKRKFYLIILSSLILVRICFAQTPIGITFYNRYGIDTGTGFASSIQTSDNGFISVGYTSDDTISSNHYLNIVKTNSLGTVEWSKFYFNSAYSDASKIIKTNDNAFLVLGSYRATLNSKFQIFLLKIDAFGNIIWTRNFISSKNIFARNICNLSSGKFMLSINEGDYLFNEQPSAGILKVDENGNFMDFERYANTNNSNFGDIVKTSDGGCLCALDTGNAGIGSVNSFLLKYNSSGNLVWNKMLSTSVNDFSDELFETSEHIYLGLYFNETAGGSYYQTSLVKFDSLGTIYWTLQFPSPEAERYSISEDSFQKYNLLLTDGPYGNYLYKVNNSGNIIGTKYYYLDTNNTYANMNVNECIQTYDGGFLLTGGSNEPQQGSYRKLFGVLIKTDSNGVLSCNEVAKAFNLTNNWLTDLNISNGSIPFLSSLLTQSQPITLMNSSNFYDTKCITIGIPEIRNQQLIMEITPNPFTSQTTISFSEEQKNTLIIITDIVGKELKTTTLTGRQLVIDKGEMQAGIYFVQIIDSNNTKITKKIVVQ